ncbi:MAG: citrate synthase [Polaromonas sp.]|uniref:citrate/2-methylcitrate synthase n=1 Tax=Polaromonas sp. TaxID=1869339 RepID=UPI0025E02DC8|nr:citrate/2-methylcitrate synthase [Polaromonas sp.]MBI2727165.1 citrate synthase [Polaromonas sp.]
MTTKKPAISSPPTASEEYISREQALKVLGVKAQTLYAYVSRGWIRSIQQPGGGRRSLYALMDVESAKARTTARTGHSVAAASAMRWGEPIIPTAITEITPDGPRYRGKLAVNLARSETHFENVSEWLWSGFWSSEKVLWTIKTPPKQALKLFSIDHGGSDKHFIWWLAQLTMLVGSIRAALIEQGNAPNATESTRELIQLMIGSMGKLGPNGKFSPMEAGESVTGALIRVLGLEKTEHNERALNGMLILMADHELTGSTFSARVAASHGALLHACLTAALATHSGQEIGRMPDRIENFYKSSSQAEGLKIKVKALQQQGLAAPGFGHPAYTKGDPRAEFLIQLAEQTPKKSMRLKNALDFLKDVKVSMRLYPRAEMGMVILGMGMRLPSGAVAGILTIARMAGWVAHIQEQRLSGYMLRPRAKYVEKPQE